MEKLMIACLRGKSVRSPENDFDNTKVHEVTTPSTDSKLLLWNSSNSNSFDVKECLSMISDELEQGNESGSVSCPYSMNEIMFEVKN